MNPYDAANNLAKALGQSKEYQDFQEAQITLKGDSSAREMLIDFRTEQLNLQRQQMSGVEVAPEQEEKMEKLYQVISMNLTLKRYLEAEYRLGVLLQDIQKIIAEATGDLFDPELFGVPDELTGEDEAE